MCCACAFCPYTNAQIATQRRECTRIRTWKCEMKTNRGWRARKYKSARESIRIPGELNCTRMRYSFYFLVDVVEHENQITTTARNIHKQQQVDERKKCGTNTHSRLTTTKWRAEKTQNNDKMVKTERASDKMPSRFIGCWFDDPKCDERASVMLGYKLAISAVQNHNTQALTLFLSLSALSVPLSMASAPTTAIYTRLYTIFSYFIEMKLTHSIE